MQITELQRQIAVLEAKVREHRTKNVLVLLVVVRKNVRLLSLEKQLGEAVRKQLPDKQEIDDLLDQIEAYLASGNPQVLL